MPFSVRDAVAADAHAIAKVHVTTWQVSYKGLVPQSRLDALSVVARAERWSGMLAARATSGQSILVAEAGGGEIVGFASGGPPGSADDGTPAYEAVISSLYVLPSYQGRGIGTRLLRELARRLAGGGARSVFLWCLKDGPAARFYAQAGATAVRTKTESWDGVDVAIAGYAWHDLEGRFAP